MKHQRHRTHFPSTRLLLYISVDILEKLSRTKNGSQYVVIITNSYSMATQEIFTSNTSTLYTEKTSVQQLVETLRHPSLSIEGQWSFVCR